MTSAELRKKFLDFFKERGHKIVPSSSLITDDPSVLLTTAGMQQFKPYFMGSADPVRDFGAKRATSIQKCFRTSDIDEVGDDSHLTFFEMLGHFSFGDYFKKETIEWTYELLTKVFGISSDRISATVFIGDKKISFDEESYDAWSKFLPPDRIRKGPRTDNIWGPAGPEGPCGAANEVYVDNLEVATLVFMEYFFAKDGGLTPLPQKGVDVGWGLERLAMIVQNKKNIFETDLFDFTRTYVPSDISDKAKRIIGDHARAIVFLASDGIVSSNKGAGYVLRRLMRRLMAHSDLPGLGSVKGFGDRYGFGIIDAQHLFEGVQSSYNNFYSGLRAGTALGQFKVEYGKFGDALKKGIGELKKTRNIDAIFAFKLYETYGLPFEIIKDFAGESDNLDREDFEKEFKKHQDASRAGQEKKFGGHGLILNTGELRAADAEELKKVTRLHTATHLLQASLRKISGESVRQAGSDITTERTRFDFTFEKNLAEDEIKKVEDLVNFAISKSYDVETREMPYEEALKQGALHFFKEKYPPIVKVYSVGDLKKDPPEIFSMELCGGPHVKNTSEIGHFKILKQEPLGSGLRRIRATVD